jgi:TolB protein
MVPAGSVEVDVMRGFENHFEQHKVEVKSDSTTQLTIRMAPLYISVDAFPNWVSGDVHVHMNYAGTYRNTPAHLIEQAAAENLGLSKIWS